MRWVWSVGLVRTTSCAFYSSQGYFRIHIRTDVYTNKNTHTHSHIGCAQSVDSDRLAHIAFGGLQAKRRCDIVHVATLYVRICRHDAFAPVENPRLGCCDGSPSPSTSNDMPPHSRLYTARSALATSEGSFIRVCLCVCMCVLAQLWDRRRPLWRSLG